MRQFLLLIVFFSSANSDNDGILYFNGDIEEFSKCIEHHELFKVDRYYGETGIEKAVADHAKSRFSDATISIDSLKILIMLLIEDLKDGEFNHLHDKLPWMHLQTVTEQIIMNCVNTSRGYEPSSRLSNDIVNRREPPQFDGESLLLSELLNYVLVDWPFNLQHMISTQEGRALLRRYAEDAETILGLVLNYLPDHTLLRTMLRRLWIRRAEQYFDGRDIRLPYIRHFYTMDLNVPHTYNDADILSYRSSQSFSERNPMASRSHLNRLLNIHSTDRRGHGEYDVFSRYQRNNMSTAENYMEIHWDQFYRIIFFFQELRFAGISSDVLDTYNGTIPYSVVSEEKQAIVYNDNAYRDYLLNRRREELRNGIMNPIRRNMARSARVCEESLVALVNSRAASSITISTSTVSFEITTTSRTISTTPKYRGPEVESACENHPFKHEDRNHETFHDNSCKNDGKEESINFQDSNLERHCDYVAENLKGEVGFMKHGFLRQHIDINMGEHYGYLLFPEDESLNTIKLLSDMIDAFSRSIRNCESFY